MTGAHDGRDTIPFNRATYLGSEIAHVQDAAAQSWLSGGGKYTALCEARLKEVLGCQAAFLTPSCTAALEMAAIILGVGPGDEVILPSYTFVTSASAFVIFGARAVFVDIDRDTMNIDCRAIERAITPRTKAIVVVHYGGVVCDMDAILEVAGRHGIPVVEDAAQAIGAGYKGRPAGAFGALAAFSFHETKNITSGGEGGALVVNDGALLERARIARDKGTNRAAFREGRVDKYTWVGLGSSYLMNEVSAAWLWAQLERLAEVNDRRLFLQARYREALAGRVRTNRMEVQPVPPECRGNGHVFFLKTNGAGERRELLSFLSGRGVQATFHYVPLHTSPAGRRFGRFAGNDENTTREAERLVRLPLFFNMTDAQQAQVIDRVLEFFSQ
jgi:dTDP-4-amino-4,6-dideoxygalactose transaminase